MKVNINDKLDFIYNKTIINEDTYKRWKSNNNYEYIINNTYKMLNLIDKYIDENIQNQIDLKIRHYNHINNNEEEITFNIYLYNPYNEFLPNRSWYTYNVNLNTTYLEYCPLGGGIYLSNRKYQGKLFINFILQRLAVEKLKLSYEKSQLLTHNVMY